MKKNLALFFIFCCITLIPLSLWGKQYFVGGDDSKLYYLFPAEYLKNFTLTLISDNQLGSMGYYFSQAYISPFILLIWLFKTTFFFTHIQLLLFGLNLGFSWLCFYFLLGLWINSDTWQNWGIKVVAALLYCFSSFNFYTLGNSQLFGMYLASVFPFTFFLVLQAIRKKRLELLLIASLTLSLFSTVLLSLPWLLALVIVTLPLVLSTLLTHPGRTIIYSIIFAVLLILLNFYWVFHFFYAPYSSDNRASQSVVTSTVANVTRKDNEYVIRYVSEHNQLIYPYLQLFHRFIQKDYGWSSSKIFEQWHMSLIIPNLFFPLMILVGGVLAQKAKRHERVFYVSALWAWIIALYFYTVNIGDWGLNLFLWLNQHVPGFVMFRNMYDKFGLALAFSSALVFASSFKIVADHIKYRSLKIFLLLGAVILILFNAKPFLLDEYHSDPLWTTTQIYTKINNFNPDFYQLLGFLKTQNEASRYLWLPLTTANYIFIQDYQLSNHYYIGVSPLSFLANKSDLNGFLSFPSSDAIKLKDHLLNKNYVEVGKLFQRFNVKYFIANNQIEPQLRKSYLLTYNSPADIFEAQQDAFKKAILGEKVTDIGERYSIYEVAKQYQNEKIYLTDDVAQFPSDFSQVEYQKNNSYEYELVIKNLAKKQYLVFLDPYHQKWQLYWLPSHRLFIAGSHDVPFGYANAWVLDPQEIIKNYAGEYQQNADGSLTLKLKLYFLPQSYFNATLKISLATIGLIIGFLLIGIVPRKIMTTKQT